MDGGRKLPSELASEMGILVPRSAGGAPRSLQPISTYPDVIFPTHGRGIPRKSEGTVSVGASPEDPPRAARFRGDQAIQTLRTRSGTAPDFAPVPALFHGNLGSWREEAYAAIYLKAPRPGLILIDEQRWAVVGQSPGWCRGAAVAVPRGMRRGAPLVVGRRRTAIYAIVEMFEGGDGEYRILCYHVYGPCHFFLQQSLNPNGFANGLGPYPLGG